MTDTHPPDPTPSPAPARRRLLQWAAFGLGGLASVAMGIPVVGYLLGAVLRPSKNEWIKLGALRDFPEHQTRLVNFKLPKAERWNGETDQTSAYVRHRGNNQFQVFAVNCAHLGCPVSWFPQSGLFMCPCHGGVYYEDGRRASGPPPRGLFEYKTKVEDGALWVFGGHLPTLHDTLTKATD